LKEKKEGLGCSMTPLRLHSFHSLEKGRRTREKVPEKRGQGTEQVVRKRGTWKKGKVNPDS